METTKFHHPGPHLRHWGHLHGHPSRARDSSAGLTALLGRQGVFSRLVHAEEITVMAISLLFPSDPRLDLIFSILV